MLSWKMQNKAAGNGMERNGEAWWGIVRHGEAWWGMGSLPKWTNNWSPHQHSPSPVSPSVFFQVTLLCNNLEVSLLCILLFLFLLGKQHDFLKSCLGKGSPMLQFFCSLYLIRTFCFIMLQSCFSSDYKEVCVPFF